jgi:FKBP-type peptidyl-prolyl cis-trans isomerase
MTIRRWLLLFFAGAILTGCMDPITTVQCEATAFTVTDVRGDTVVTSTGLRWIEGSPGAGTTVDWCRLTAVHYDAYLLDGTRFESSREAAGPLVFTPGLSVLMAGLQQGVIGVSRGGTRRLIIPPGLGFGAETRRDAIGQVVVPPNSTLIYDIEVVDIAR